MKAILVVIDMQEKIAGHVEGIEEVKKKIEKIIKAFEIFNFPIIYTRQIKLGKPLYGSHFIEKSTFSCWKERKFVEEIEKLGIKRVVLVGIETHICVIQTAIHMKKDGYEVEVAVDATSSRNKNDKEIAIERMKQEGIKLTSVEMLIYELMESASHEKFKDILAIIKE